MGWSAVGYQKEANYIYWTLFFIVITRAVFISQKTSKIDLLKIKLKHFMNKNCYQFENIVTSACN